MKVLAVVALLAALPARAQSIEPDLFAASLQSDGKCLVQNFPTLVETVECMRRGDQEIWARLPMTPEQKTAFDALYRGMAEDARRADARGNSFAVFAASWAAPWQAFYQSLHLPPPVITVPDWVRKPTAAEMRAHFPGALKQAKLSGSALLRCLVRADGTVTACKVARETPAGYGIGAAAVEISASFKMRPMTVNGVPIDGGPVNIPFNFDKSIFSRFFR